MLFSILPAVLLSLAVSADPAIPVEPHDAMPELNAVVKPPVYRNAAMEAPLPLWQSRFALASLVPQAAPKGRL